MAAGHGRGPGPAAGGPGAVPRRTRGREDLFTLRFLKDARVLPLPRTRSTCGSRWPIPTDPFVLAAVAMAAGKPVEASSACPPRSNSPWRGSTRSRPRPTRTPSADFGDFDEEDIEHLKDLASEAPVIRMVNQMIQKAVESRASDIHIEPFADELKVRYRVDGILKEVDAPPVRSTAAVISRVKIMAKLNIAERRLPQDGRIPIRVQGRELDLRVSTVPTMFGESVVMRLLDKESVRFDLDALGFDGAPRAAARSTSWSSPTASCWSPGPTGSRQEHHPLYRAVSRLNTQERKIITVEDPVEYQLPGINQIQVKSAIGMTFAGALRAIVRQDPDIIMVGEMRDLETARIAVQSALTGHVVLSTLHTNDAASGVTRLLDMGVEDYLLTSTINGILAQRLVRSLCPHCREPYDALPELAATLRTPSAGRCTADQALSAGRLRALQRHRLSRSAGHHRGAADDRPIRKLVLESCHRHRDPAPRHRGGHGHHVRGRAAQGDGRAHHGGGGPARGGGAIESMPNIFYKAVKLDGEAVEGETGGGRRGGGLVSQLQSQGLSPARDPLRRRSAGALRAHPAAASEPEGDRHPDPGAGHPDRGRADPGPLAPGPDRTDRRGASGAGALRPAGAGARWRHLLQRPGGPGGPVPAPLHQHGPGRRGQRRPGSGSGPPGRLSGADRRTAPDRHLRPGLSPRSCCSSPACR